jgi:O-antigen/teichoic acid export membrane protein
VWGDDEGALRAIARNVSTRYLAFAVDGAIGLLMLPFNLEHLGKPVYGLWILTASITVSFGLLDLGYGGALVRFIARYRALRDRRGLNEILSTLFVIYSGIGAATFCVALLLAGHLDTLFRISPEHVGTARHVLLITSSYIAIRFAFSTYGGVIVGFQRYHLNNGISIVTSIAVAAVNVAVLLAGFGLVGLVAATTAVRVLGLFLYRQNAYRVYPGLRIRSGDFKLSRLREVSGFSAYMLLLDCGYRLSYSADTLVLGAFMGTAAVALWAPAQRLSELIVRVANQLNEALFPFVVNSDATSRTDQLQAMLIQGTRLSLAMAVPVAGGVALLAHPLIEAWVGPSFGETATVLQILAAAVVLRVWTATSSTILRGAGEHKRLTVYVVATGLANVVLSIALVKPWGLIGVATGTVVPLAITATVIAFPQACRRVGLPPLGAFREAVWPALWPAVGAGAFLQLVTPLGGASLIASAVKLAAAATIYAALFFGVAIGRSERQLYLSKVRELVPSAGAGGRRVAGRQPAVLEDVK